MTMTFEEFEQKIIDASTSLGSILVYDTGQLESSDDWGELADEIANLASHIARSANSFAAYASVARRLANKE